MLNRISRLALCLAVLATALIAFLGVRSFELFAYNLDADAVVYADKTRPDLDDAAFNSEIQQIADDSDTQISHLVIDLENSVNGGRLFVTDHPNQAVGQGEKYPAFTRSMSLNLEPMAELRDNRSGYYFVSGDEASLSKISAGFEKLGVEPQTIPVHQSREILSRAVEVPAKSLSMLVTFLLTTLTMAGVILNSRTLGVIALQGRSWVETLGLEAWQAARTIGFSFAASLGILLPVMYRYNGLSHFGLFLRIQTTVFALLLCAMIVFHLLAHVLVSRVGILQRVKGELRARTTHLLVYAARLVAIAFVFSGTTLLINQQQLVDTKASANDVWASTAGNVQLGLRSGESQESERQASLLLGTWLAEQDRAGQLILAQRLTIADLDVAGTLNADPRTEFLIVNSTYLKERPLLDSQGKAIAGPGPDEALLVVPSGDTFDEAILLDQSQKLVDGEVEFLNETLKGAEKRERTVSPTVRLMRSQAKQSAFTYVNSVSGSRSPFAEDPIVLVLASELPIFSPHNWVSAMSTGQVILRDKQRTIDDLKRSDLIQYVAAINEIRVTNASQEREVRVRANVYRVNLFAILIALATTSAAFAVVHSRRYSTSIFAQFIHGWTFFRRHYLLLAIDSGAIILMTVYWLWVTRRIDPNLPIEFQPMPADAGLSWTASAAAVAIMLISLHLASSSQTRRRSAD